MEVSNINSNKKSIFPWILLAFTILGIVVVSSVLVWLWGALENYEKNTPQVYMAHFARSIVSNEYDGLMEYAKAKQTDFFKEDEYKQYMHELLGSNAEDIEVVEISGDDSDEHIFELRNGDNAVSFTLLRTAEGYDVTQEEIELHSMEITASPGADVYANGKPLGDSYIVDSKLLTTSFNELPELGITEYSLPERVTYKLEGFYKQPKITAKASDAATEYVVEQSERKATVSMRANEQETAELTEFSTNAAKAYANFISKDLSFGEYAQFLVKGTSHYKATRSFDNSWYIDHDGFEFSDMETSEVQKLSKDCYSVCVSFKYKVFKKYFDPVFDTFYRFYIVKTDSGYKLVDVALK